VVQPKFRNENHGLQEDTDYEGFMKEVLLIQWVARVVHATHSLSLKGIWINRRTQRKQRTNQLQKYHSPLIR